LAGDKIGAVDVGWDRHEAWVAGRGVGGGGWCGDSN
jgi:hypothetical protein